MSIFALFMLLLLMSFGISFVWVVDQIRRKRDLQRLVEHLSNDLSR